MNTLQKISVTLPLAILVVIACDSIVGTAPVNAQAQPAAAPAAAIPVLGVWKIKAIKYCPQSAREPNMPDVGQSYEIYDIENNGYGIRIVNGTGMPEWNDLVLKYKANDSTRRPRGIDVIANGQPRCDVGPSLFADRLFGCSVSGNIKHCFHIDFVENSPLHPDKEWSPYITYMENSLHHNGIIH